MPDADNRHLEALYAGEIRYADDEIGKLLAALDRLGLAHGTLVVFTADHGETLGEHDDYFNHGPSVYDTEIRIPLSVGGPGIDAAGRTVKRPACNIDLAPTLLEYAGLPIAQGYGAFLPRLAPAAGARSWCRRPAPLRSGGLSSCP